MADVHTEMREVVVPPEKRVVNVEVLPSQQEYKPGQKATVKVKLTDLTASRSSARPSSACTTRASNTSPAARTCRKSRRSSGNGGGITSPQTESTPRPLVRQPGALHARSAMLDLGIFGDLDIEEMNDRRPVGDAPMIAGVDRQGLWRGRPAGTGCMLEEAGRNEGRLARDGDGKEQNLANDEIGGERVEAQAAGPASSRRCARSSPTPLSGRRALTTDKDGIAEVNLDHAREPDRLEDQGLGDGPRHQGRPGRGRGHTKKDLLVRLQAPRFFVQKDEVVLSANVHNYLKTQKDVTVYAGTRTAARSVAAGRP